MANSADPCLVDKWRRDSDRLPLTEDHRELYEIIHRWFWFTLRDHPDLVNCRGFNDRMQWLKLFDQRYETVRCTDKLLVREYVRARLGSDHAPKLLATYEDADQIDFAALPDRFVIKPNHDCGNVILVKDKKTTDLAEIRERMRSALAVRFGWDGGEWAYSFIQRKVLVEEMLEYGNSENPPDYKFLCVDGEVRFLHFLYDRGTHLKEQTISLEGHDLKTPFYTPLPYGDKFVKPNSWEEMLSIARTLSAGWKFVRVDLYSLHGQIYFGEMTFWPGAGTYPGDGQVTLGRLLDFDRSTFLPFLLPKLGLFASS
jgi:hypothetical protein